MCLLCWHSCDAIGVKTDPIPFLHGRNSRGRRDWLLAEAVVIIGSHRGDVLGMGREPAVDMAQTRVELDRVGPAQVGFFEHF